MCVKNDKVFIYALIDPVSNSVRYIGKTENLYKRYYQHLQELQDSKKSSYHSKNWIRLLFSQGLAPKIDILELCTKSNWAEKEMYWIDFYKKIGANLTNMTLGGEGGGMLGKASPSRLPVSVYNLQGELLKYCKSLCEAEKFTGIHTGKISQVCRKKRHSAGGFVFRYDNDAFSYNPKFDASEIKNFQKLEVYEIDATGKILNKFQQADKAAKYCQVNRSTIVYVCNHPFSRKRLRVCKNKHFVYAKNYEDIVRTLEKSKTLANNHAEVCESEP